MKRFLILIASLISYVPFLLAQEGLPMIRYGNFEQMGVQHASTAKLLKVPKFTVLKDGCAVKGFEVSGVVPGKQMIGPYVSETDSLTDAQYRYINSLEKEGQVWFHHIQVNCKDGNSYILGKDNTEFSIYFFTID